MANQSAQVSHQDSIFLVSNIDLTNWVLVDQIESDDDAIYAEVLSLDSFDSDEVDTLEIGDSSPDRGDLVELGPTQIVFEGVSDGSLIVGKDVEVCDVGCDYGGDDGVDGNCSPVAVTVEGGEGFGGGFGGSVDLGKNPFLEMETLHQFLGNAIEASHGLNSTLRGCVPVEEVAFYSAVSHDMNVGEVNGNESLGGDEDEVHHDDDVEEEEDEMDNGYGLDDELVPWGVVDRFERQRMRKLGKRSFAKMTKSKKMPHLTIMRGCVRGKHGLGLKAY